MRVAVIGLDGATFRVLEPLAKRGEIPTIAKLMKEGSKGQLETCLPHYTTPAWKCYSTGKDPSKLGVYNFYKIYIDKNNNRINTKLVNSTDFKAKEIWDYLSENGLRSCVINMHDTTPAKKINGIMVSDHILGDYYCHPPEINEILVELNYKDPDLWLVVDDREKYAEILKKTIQSRFDLAKYFIEREGKNIDFLHLTIFHIDSVQHSFWNDFDVIAEFWNLIDENIKEILDLIRGIDEDTIVFLISDHGHVKKEDEFYLSEYLIQRGYLNIKRDYVSKFVYALGLDTSRLYNIFSKFGLLPLLRKSVPKNLRRRIPNKEGDVPADIVASRINLKKSKVIHGGSGILYLIEKDKKFIERIIRELEELKHPITKENVIKRVYRKEEVYSNCGEETPDLIIYPNDGYVISEHVGMDGKIWGYERGRNRWKSTHDRYGIFIAYGKDIKTGNVNARIYDIAPTILHIFGLPIPRDMDGRVLREIFKEGAEYAIRKPKYEDYEKYVLREKIRELKRSGRAK